MYIWGDYLHIKKYNIFFYNFVYRSELIYNNIIIPSDEKNDAREIQYKSKKRLTYNPDQ
jgi:hypothetical protein